MNAVSHCLLSRLFPWRALVSRQDWIQQAKSGVLGSSWDACCAGRQPLEPVARRCSPASESGQTTARHDRSERPNKVNSMTRRGAPAPQVRSAAQAENHKHEAHDLQSKNSKIVHRTGSSSHPISERRDAASGRSRTLRSERQSARASLPIECVRHASVCCVEEALDTTRSAWFGTDHAPFLPRAGDDVVDHALAQRVISASEHDINSGGVTACMARCGSDSRRPARHL